MEDRIAKTAVITGATSGIGLATAREFAKQGWNIVLAARSDKKLDNVASELGSAGATVHTHALDVDDTEAVDALANVAREMFGIIDVWVNNAGVYMAGRFEKTPLDDARRLFDTNVFGVMNGSKSALRHFRDQGFGTLINVASVNAVAPMPNFGVYSASKAAVRALTEAIRMETALDGMKDIHVCTVMPAGIDTDLYHASANYTGRELLVIEPVYSSETVAKRIYGLTTRPRAETIVGGAGRLLSIERRLSPALYESSVAKYADTDPLGAGDVTPTSGNLYNSSVLEPSSDGGWQTRRIKGETVDKAATVGLVGLVSIAALTLVLLMRGTDRSDDQ